MNKTTDKPEMILALIDNLREEEKIPITQMTYGLCDSSQYAKVLRAKNRRFDKLIIDAFYQRLGKNLRNFECLLDADEYMLFEKREEFRDAFFKNDMEKAKAAAERCATLGICRRSRVHQQMALLFRVYLMMKEDKDSGEILRKAKEALELTIPEFKLAELDKYLYSEVELILLDIILKEEEKLKGVEKVYAFYEKVYRVFREDRYLDNEQIFRFAPMIYRLVRIKLDRLEFEAAGAVCDRMISGLIQDNKILYLTEFLECKGRAKAGMAKMETNKIPEIVEARAIKDALKKYYPEWSPETDIQIYWEFMILPTGEIVKQRRKNLGLSQEDLALDENEEICSVDTISRLENGSHKTSLAVEKQILSRLRMAPERFHREFITDDYSDVRKLKRIAEAQVVGDNTEAEKRLEVLEEAHNRTLYPSNEQCIMQRRACLNMERAQEFDVVIDELQKVMEMSLKNIPGENDEIGCYLFNTEFFVVEAITMIYRRMGDSDRFFRLCNNLLNDIKNIGRFDNTFYFRVITLGRMLAGEYGNRRMFDRSNEIAAENLVKCFKFNRLDMIDSFLYCLAWNENMDERKKNKDKRIELRAAFALADLEKKAKLKERIVKQCDLFYDKELLQDLHYELM
jgi:transcriptional regulator with XRE-family HTH domain